MSNPALQPATESPAQKAGLLDRARTVCGDAAWVFVHNRDPDVAMALVENEQLTLIQRIKFIERRDLNPRVFQRIHTLDHWWKSQSIRVAAAKNPRIPVAILHPVVRSLDAFHLCDIANSPYITRDTLIVIERTLQDRLKVMPIGQRITMARKATPRILEILFKGSPHRFVVEAALANPRMNERVLEVGLAQGDWELRALELVLKHPEWGVRYPVRRALFRNRRLEIGVRRELAQEITRQDLMELVRIHHKDHTLIRIATIELERRGYPDLHVKGIHKRTASEERVERLDGPRGMSIDELRALMERNTTEAGDSGEEQGD